MTSLQVQSRVQGSIVNFDKERGSEEEAVGIRQRGDSNQLHKGLEVICDQILSKRARIASVQFSSQPKLRRSARLRQKEAESEILMNNAQVGLVMAVPASISAPGTLPVLRLREVVREERFDDQRYSAPVDRVIRRGLFRHRYFGHPSIPS